MGSASAPSAPARADWILTDGVIWTGGRSPSRAYSAMAIGGGRILALGDAWDLAPLRGPGTRTLSLEGGFVVPGFVDAHIHLLAGGLQLSRVDLRGASSREEFERRVAERARGLPEGSWILGGGWSEADWGGGLPNRDWLDRVAPRHPIFLRRADLHMAVVNSLALALGRIDEATPGFGGGRIDRDPVSGELTGIVRERGVLRMASVIPPLSDGEREAALRAAVGHGLRHGITQFHEMGALEAHRGTWDSLRVLRRLHAEGHLPARVVAALPAEDWQEVAGLVKEEGPGDDRLRWGVVKGFVDGSLGSATAWFHEPYADDPDNRGELAADLEGLERDLTGAVAAGLQPAVHAIGDRANDWLLDVYARIAASHPGRDLRLRVEHAQHLTPEAVLRTGGGGPIISAQPLHLVDDGRWAIERLGPQRMPGSFAIGSLERAGARLAFGSDWPVAPLNPFAAIQAAVTRRLRGGNEPGGRRTGEVWFPAERIGLDVALRAHTIGAAAAAFLEGETGSLEVGKRADLAVLTGNPFDADPEGLTEEVRVRMTFVEGVLAP